MQQTESEYIEYFSKVIYVCVQLRVYSLNWILYWQSSTVKKIYERKLLHPALVVS